MKKVNKKLFVKPNETFTHEGSTYLCKEVKTITCNGCALRGKPLCNQVSCIPADREDLKWVSFKQVNKDLYL